MTDINRNIAADMQLLTDKERETLRLVVRGHDAKSMARHLSLSVHTINERLRTARRKLSVTSSREAARLLSQHEGLPPNSLVYEDLGEADAGESLHHPVLSEDRQGGDHDARSYRAWVIGGLIMIISALAVVLISTMAIEGSGTATDSALTEAIAARDEAVEASARQWLRLVDAQDWQASFDAAGNQFRKPNTVASWREASELARVPLGKVRKRESVTIMSVNAPPSGYQIVRFKSDFEKKSGAIETVTLELDEGIWKVVGYVID